MGRRLTVEGFGLGLPSVGDLLLGYFLDKVAYFARISSINPKP